MKATTPVSRLTHVLFALCAMLVFVLAGCGTGSNGVTRGTGIGDSAGPWPQPPDRTSSTANAARPGADEAPKATVFVEVVANAPKDTALHLDMERVEVKFENTWVPVLQRKDIAETEALPLVAREKGGTFLLARTQIPRRAYSHLRLHLADSKTVYVVDEKTTLPLTVQGATLELKDVKLDANGPNLITLNIDGTKVTTAEKSATLPADALTVTVGQPAGGVKGKLTPSLPTSRVELYWKDSKTLMGTGIPALADGDFTINSLPPGDYRIEVRAPGHHLVEEIKGLLAIEQKMATLKPMTLAADATQQ